MAAAKIEPLKIRILAEKNGARLADGSWPIAGMYFGDADGKSDPPARCNVGAGTLANWRDRGVVSTEGSRVVLRSGGPPENPWKVDAEKGIPHLFEHLDAVVFHTEDGDVRYEVVENPDKWPDEKDGETGFGGEVRWVYGLKLVSGDREPRTESAPKKAAEATA